MFDAATVRAVETIAARYGYEPAALLAVGEVESGGTVFAIVNGKQEPLIRFEGHYFDRRLDEKDQKKARAAGLANPTAGAVANPASQAARWRMLERAIEINADAALESVSWGLGQVMGAHWKWLGFGSVTELVNLCRSGAAGQVELMAKFIDKAGLGGVLKSKDWAAFARGYNGPAFRKNAYDTKMAAAYKRWKAGTATVKPSPDSSVTMLQTRLVAHGFKVAVDGIRGAKTDAALKAFQKAKGLVVDGIAGSATWTALSTMSPAEIKANQPAKPAPSPVAPKPVAPAAPEPIGFWAWLFSFILPAKGK
ncbi:MAG: DUF3380 domain-containing protein [Mesorhizobium sp.]|nr:N-acetylmuramidase domain-containing protein [Mesorhizobium sp.]MBL8578075.1 DUF3380 domain-containing protein [Mesorhizobium sp.]